MSHYIPPESLEALTEHLKAHDREIDELKKSISRKRTDFIQASKDLHESKKTMQKLHEEGLRKLADMRRKTEQTVVEYNEAVQKRDDFSAKGRNISGAKAIKKAREKLEGLETKVKKKMRARDEAASALSHAEAEFKAQHEDVKKREGSKAKLDWELNVLDNKVLAKTKEKQEIEAAIAKKKKIAELKKQLSKLPVMPQMPGNQIHEVHGDYVHSIYDGKPLDEKDGTPVYPAGPNLIAKASPSKQSSSSNTQPSSSRHSGERDKHHTSGGKRHKK